MRRSRGHEKKGRGNLMERLVDCRLQIVDWLGLTAAV